MIVYEVEDIVYLDPIPVVPAVSPRPVLVMDWIEMLTGRFRISSIPTGIGD